MNDAVLLLTCPGRHCEWLALDTEEPYPGCVFCAGAPLHVSAAWRPSALPWCEFLIGHVLCVESARRFLWTLSYYATLEHPTAPSGSHWVTPGMQLVPEDTPRGDLLWHFTRTAGSEN